jgi:hypothetical protein
MTHSIEAMALEEAGKMTQVFAASTGGEVFWSDNAGDTWKVIITGLAPVSKGSHYRGMTEHIIPVR